MQVPAWQVASWSNVRVSVEKWNEMADTLKFFGSTQGTSSDDAGLRCGQAIWGSVEDGDEPFGLAWDWREVREGLVALSDPMTIISNVVLIEDGEPVDEFKRIVHLNSVIYQLPWQRHTARERGSLCA